MIQGEDNDEDTGSVFRMPAHHAGRWRRPRADRGRARRRERSGDPDCLIPGVCTDGWRGTGAQPLVGIGGWIETNTPFAGLILIVDGDTANPIDFDGAILTTQHQFFGYIDPGGFTTFEFRETEGTSEDAKYIFADDFFFGYETPVTLDAPLTGLNVLLGSWEGGNLASLDQADDAYLSILSEPNGPGTLELGGVTIVAGSPETVVSALDVTLEAAADTGNVRALLRLRNFETNQWERVGRMLLEPGDTRRYFLNLPGGNAYVRDGDGRILMQVLALGSAVALPDGFQMRVDQVRVGVVPAD
jgi:hypothetical protein